MGQRANEQRCKGAKGLGRGRPRPGAASYFLQGLRSGEGMIGGSASQNFCNPSEGLQKTWLTLFEPSFSLGGPAAHGSRGDG